MMLTYMSVACCALYTRTAKAKCFGFSSAYNGSTRAQDAILTKNPEDREEKTRSLGEEALSLALKRRGREEKIYVRFGKRTYFIFCPRAKESRTRKKPCQYGLEFCCAGMCNKSRARQIRIQESLEARRMHQSRIYGVRLITPGDRQANFG